MPSISEIRSQYPQYNDMSDAQLGDALYSKFYSDMDRATFDQKVGLGPAQEPAPAAPQERGIGAQLKEAFDYPSHYKQMVSEATGLMGEGVEQAKKGTLSDIAIGTGKTALGGLGYLTSPINAALRTTIGRPLEATTGIPKEYGEFAASMALPIPKRIPIPGATTKAATPTTAELEASYVAARKSPEVAEAVIKPEAIAKQVKDISNKLVNEEWLDPVLAPKTFHIIDKLSKEGAASMQTIDSARRTLGRVIKGGGDDAAAAYEAKHTLDNWMKGATAAEAIAGDIPLAQSIMQAGRGDYTAAVASTALDKRIAKAERKTGTAHSGLNLTNTLKSKVDQFLDSPDSRGLSSSQRAALDSFVKGSTSENVIRYVGKLFGGGGGLGAVVAGGAGYGALGGWGTLLPVAGFGLTKLSNTLSLRNANKLSEMIRSQSPLGRRLQGPLEDWSNAAQELQISPTARNVARATIASRNLANNLKDADITVTPNDLLRSLFGQGSGRSEPDEQE